MIFYILVFGSRTWNIPSDMAAKMKITARSDFACLRSIWNTFNRLRTKTAAKFASFIHVQCYLWHVMRSRGSTNFVVLCMQAWVNKGGKPCMPVRTSKVRAENPACQYVQRRKSLPLRILHGIVYGKYMCIGTAWLAKNIHIIHTGTALSNLQIFRYDLSFAIKSTHKKVWEKDRTHPQSNKALETLTNKQNKTDGTSTKLTTTSTEYASIFSNDWHHEHE